MMSDVRPAAHPPSTSTVHRGHPMNEPHPAAPVLRRRHVVGLLLVLAALPRPLHAAEAPLFSRHVVPVLSRLGCNAGGSCHGTNKGQGGLRLSLFGGQPSLDFERLTREAGARR